MKQNFKKLICLPKVSGFNQIRFFFTGSNESTEGRLPRHPRGRGQPEASVEDVLQLPETVLRAPIPKLQQSHHTGPQ
jgi:hypothetical protein